MQAGCSRNSVRKCQWRVCGIPVDYDNYFFFFGDNTLLFFLFFSSNNNTNLLYSPGLVFGQTACAPVFVTKSVRQVQRLNTTDYRDRGMNVEHVPRRREGG